MRSDDPEFQELVAEFPELTADDVVLEKELYAHFGLLFFVFGLMEHALMNIALVARLHEKYRRGEIATAEEWSREWDRQEPHTSGLTFGKLAIEVDRVAEFEEIKAQIAKAKRDRDYFAHRFFRESAAVWASEDGIRLLLVRLGNTRREVKSLEEELERRFNAMQRRMRLPPVSDNRLAKALADLKSEAGTQIAEKRGGWEQ